MDQQGGWKTCQGWQSHSLDQHGQLPEIHVHSLPTSLKSMYLSIFSIPLFKELAYMYNLSSHMVNKKCAPSFF